MIKNQDLKSILTTYNNFNSGRIIAFYDYIIVVEETSSKSSFLGEVIHFNSYDKPTHRGIVMNIEHNLIKLILIEGEETDLDCGNFAFRTATVISTIAGFGVLEQLVTPLGEFLNSEDLTVEKQFINKMYLLDRVNVMNPSPSIIDREAVATPFLTGIISIDIFTPIGCGQRQLLIGDFNTGKTSIALTAIINQLETMNVVDRCWREFEMLYKYQWRSVRFMPCIFVAIGKRKSEITRYKKLLTDLKAFYFTTIIFTGPDTSASIQYLAPYAGCAMGEWFRDRGYHSLIIYDDLSNHAIAYRQISLLLRRPPGREAYPGDIFYLHSRLLERAAQLRKSLGGGSLTALPIIVTQSNDISAYIATNVISITDGQVFLSPFIINKGIKPGIDLGLSVSRVGSKAQYEGLKYVSKKTKQLFSLFRMYEGITKLGTEVDSYLQIFIDRGYKLLHLITQGLYETKSMWYQIVTLFCLTEDCIDNISIALMNDYFKIFLSGQFYTEYVSEDQYDRLNKFFSVSRPALESILILDNFSFLVEDLKLLCSNYNSFFILNMKEKLEL